MITSGVNFLSFGKRERVLRRTHRKYLTYVFILAILTILLLRSMFANNKIYEELIEKPVYSNIIEDSVTHNLEKIAYLIDTSKLYIEGISYNSDNFNITVRLNDKRDIYSMVDNLKKDGFYVNSYVHKYEENGTQIYNIDIGV